MKKAFALIMAIAMIASMAAVAMADTQINPGVNETAPAVRYNQLLQTYNKADDAWGDLDETTDKVAFGKVVYVKLIGNDGKAVTNADAVKGLNVTAKWEKNGDFVKSVEIVKVDGVYAIAIATTGSSLETVNVLGEVQVKGKSYYEVKDEDGELEGKKADVKFSFDVELDLAYGEGTVAKTIKPGAKAVYDFEDTDIEEVTVEYGPISAEVSTKGMKKVLMAYNDEEVEELYDAYIDADLVFVNCVGAFRRTAEVTVDLADDEYFYEIVDGKLVAVDGEYDEWTEEFTFKTRTMGNYVISDMELVTESVAVANPSTGAAA